MNVIDIIEREQFRSDLPDFNAGDTVRVHVKVVEGSNERIQVFEGVVLRRMGDGLRRTSPLGRSRRALVWKGLSPSIRLGSTGLRWSATVKFAVPVCTTSGNGPAGLLVSRSAAVNAGNTMFPRGVSIEAGAALLFFYFKSGA